MTVRGGWSENRDDLLDRVGARRAATQDPAAALQLNVLRMLLDVVHSACDDEHLDPQVTRRILDKVIYGGVPQRPVVEQLLAERAQFVDYMAGDVRRGRQVRSLDDLRTDWAAVTDILATIDQTMWLGRNRNTGPAPASGYRAVSSRGGAGDTWRAGVGRGDRDLRGNQRGGHRGLPSQLRPGCPVARRSARLPGRVGLPCNPGSAQTMTAVAAWLCPICNELVVPAWLDTPIPVPYHPFGEPPFVARHGLIEMVAFPEPNGDVMYVDRDSVIREHGQFRTIEAGEPV